MKKQPLDFFNKDSWKVRFAVFVIDRLTLSSFIGTVGYILIKVIQ